MLKIQGNRFYYGGVSFPMPNGLYYDIFENDHSLNSITFKSENDKFRLSIGFFDYDGDIKEYCNDALQRNKNDIILQPIQKIKI